MLFLTAVLLSVFVATTASSCINCDGGNMTCVDGKCLPRCVNVTSSGECLRCRSNKFYGKKCENDCPDTCLNSACQLDNSDVVCTEGCVAGAVECRHCPGGSCAVPCIGENCRSLVCETTNGSTNTVIVIVMASFIGACFLTALGIFVVIRQKGHLKLKFILKKIRVKIQVKMKDHVKSKCQVKVKCKQLQNDNDKPGYETVIQFQPAERVSLCKELKERQSKRQMKQEFKALPQHDILPTHSGSHDMNKYKNRYRNILPFDSTRVCLGVTEGGDSDYINASYIDGYGQKRQYIAAQDPTESTTSDFWKMIWQEDVTKIVMLTEEESVSHVMYWPCYVRQDDEVYGGVSVQCLEQKTYDHHTYRCIAAWRPDAPTRKIHHFHYTSWPVHGVPNDVTSLIHFYKLVQDAGTNEVGRTLVHSSAGVGRPGTYLALAYMLEQAKYEDNMCVYNCVSDLRYQRMLMVFTKEQYMFLYQVLNEALQTPGIRPDNSMTIGLHCKDCWEKDIHCLVEDPGSVV